jgi:23S rRNA pseudouridine1911/1915/1917 synthase
LEVWPETGRKHQIRIHLSHIGHSIVGDKLYGGDEMLYLDFVKERLTAEQQLRLMLPNHALHAGQIAIPVGEGSRSFNCPPEPDFKRFALLE